MGIEPYFLIMQKIAYKDIQKQFHKKQETTFLMFPVYNLMD